MLNLTATAFKEIRPCPVQSAWEQLKSKGTLGVFRALSISHFRIQTWGRQHILFDILHKLPEVTLLIGQNSADDNSKLQPTTKRASMYIPRQEFQNPFPTAETHSSRFSLGYPRAESWGHTIVTTVSPTHSAHFQHRAARSRCQWGSRRRKRHGKEAIEEVTCVYTDRIASQGWVVENDHKHLAASCTCLYHGEHSYQ